MLRADGGGIPRGIRGIYKGLIAGDERPRGQVFIYLLTADTGHRFGGMFYYGFALAAGHFGWRF